MGISTSPRGKLDLTDLKKLGRNTIIVAVGAGLAYLTSNIVNVNVGELTVFVVPVLSFLVDAVYRYHRDNLKLEEITKKE